MDVNEYFKNQPPRETLILLSREGIKAFERSFLKALGRKVYKSNILIINKDLMTDSEKLSYIFHANKEKEYTIVTYHQGNIGEGKEDAITPIERVIKFIDLKGADLDLVYNSLKRERKELSSNG